MTFKSDDDARWRCGEVCKFDAALISSCEKRKQILHLQRDGIEYEVQKTSSCYNLWTKENKVPVEYKSGGREIETVAFFFFLFPTANLFQFRSEVATPSLTKEVVTILCPMNNPDWDERSASGASNERRPSSFWWPIYGRLLKFRQIQKGREKIRPRDVGFVFVYLKRKIQDGTSDVRLKIQQCTILNEFRAK